MISDNAVEMIACVCVTGAAIFLKAPVLMCLILPIVLWH